MPPIPWADIFALILKIIEDCQGPEPTPESLRNLRPLQRFRLERGVRDKMKLSWQDWRQHGDAIIDEVYAERDAATDDELRDLIVRARTK